MKKFEGVNHEIPKCPTCKNYMNLKHIENDRFDNEIYVYFCNYSKCTNNNLEKVCRFLVTNKIANKDLVVGFDENLVIYKDFEWDLERDEVEISDFRPFDCAKLKITINL